MAELIPAIHVFICHHPRRRVIQYSSNVRVNLQRRDYWMLRRSLSSGRATSAGPVAEHDNVQISNGIERWIASLPLAMTNSRRAQSREGNNHG
jgi:hypothetical protein